MLGRVLINTRTRPSNALILGRVLGLGISLLVLLQVKIMHYIGLSMQRKIALYV